MKEKEKSTILSVESLFKLLNSIKTNWIIFTLTVVIITGATTLYLFGLPRTYTSTAMLLPESNEDALPGNLGNLPESYFHICLHSGNDEAGDTDRETHDNHLRLFC